MLFASDLDRTLVHSLKRLPPELEASAQIVEIYEGRPITCASHTTLRLLAELAASHHFVPVTTRSRAQLARLKPVVALASGWAVCANGGTVLRDGEPDPDWERGMVALAAACATVPEAADALARALGPVGEDGWRLRERDCDALFLYSVCDAARIPADVEATARDALHELGWTAHLHGRKLYALPADLTKARAVEHVRDRLGAGGPLVTAGDSELDRGMLAMADLALVPRGSELDLAPTPLPPSARLTDREHVLAAEDILRAALDLAGASAPAAHATT